jgi:hypothetical protein
MTNTAPQHQPGEVCNEMMELLIRSAMREGYDWDRFREVLVMTEYSQGEIARAERIWNETANS